eukprot:TRINITY_DN45011_c0_g1_i1.p1 TRINITY_DN45011_c0_g1~~TRINITY_DN45011_c0_g1_i1.p1  ORF type:complete len:366 (+),score=96.04 TRINITY_DN45011_c0_g1_i1:72-1169(+)
MCIRDRQSKARTPAQPPSWGSPVLEGEARGFARFRSRADSKPAPKEPLAHTRGQPVPSASPRARSLGSRGVRQRKKAPALGCDEPANGLPRSPRLMVGDDDVPRVWTLNQRGRLTLLTMQQALKSNSTHNAIPSAGEICKPTFGTCGNQEVLRMFALLRQFLNLSKVQSSVWRQLWQTAAVAISEDGCVEGCAMINQQQFKQTLSRYLGLVQTPDVGAKLEQLFWAIPKKHPSTLSEAEFMARASSTGPPPDCAQHGLKMFERGTMEQQATMFFQMADEDRNGYLSREEMLLGFEEQGTRGQSCTDLVNKIFAVATKERVSTAAGESSNKRSKMSVSLPGFLKALRGLPQIKTYLGLKKYEVYAP